MSWRTQRNWLTVLLQNYVLTTLRNFSDLVSQGQRLPNLAVWRWFRSFRTRLAEDIHTWKFGPIPKGGPHEPCGPPLQNEVFANFRKFSGLVRMGLRLRNADVWHWLRFFGSRFVGDMWTWKFYPIGKGRRNRWCGPGFWKRGFCKSWKLLGSLQQGL